MAKKVYKKYNLKEAILILKEVHGDLVTLIEATYISAGYEATFIDKEYGTFVAQAHHVFAGMRHPNNSIKKLKETTRAKGLIKLKKDLLNKHGNTVKVIESSYVKLTTMCFFEDSQYGEWKGLPITVMNGGRHPQYRKDNKSKKFSIPTEELKAKLQAIHGDNLILNWDTFSGVAKKIKAIDKDYGEWWPLVTSLLNGKQHKARAFEEMKTTIEEVENRLFLIHGSQVAIKKETYCGVASKAIFIDSEYGEWEVIVANVICSGYSHPKRMLEKTRNTCLTKYGVDSPNKVPEISLRKARSQTKSTIKIHWKTGKELICQASWEPKVIDHLNFNKIDFDWQSETFTLPNGRTYRPDLFLIKENKWIEIKGFFRKDAQEKWEWFKNKFPNAELWDQKRLKEMGIL